MRAEVVRFVENALITSRRGQQRESLEMLDRSLAIRERVLGPAHPDVAGSLNNLAIGQLGLGDYHSAQATIERSIAIKDAALDPDHPDVALSLGNLADILHDRGELTKARELHGRVLAMRERLFGPDHPDVALALSCRRRSDRHAAGEARRALQVDLQRGPRVPADPRPNLVELHVLAVAQHHQFD